MSETQFELFLKVARFEPVEPVPVVGAVTSFYMEPVTPGLAGLSDRQKTLRMILRSDELFPGIPMIFLSNPAPALFPSMIRELRAKGRALEAADFKDLVIPDPKSDPVHALAVEDIRWFSKNIPGELKEEYGYCDGLIRFENPFDTLCAVVGASEWFLKLATDPEFALAAMEVFTEASLRGAQSLAETFGPPRWVMMAEDFPGYVKRADFERFVVPFHRRIFGLFPDAVKLLHNDSNTTHLLDAIPECGADIFHFGPEVDVAAAKSILGRRLALMGNVSPMNILLRGTDEEVRAHIEDVLTKGAPGGGFALSTGGELNPGTDPARMNLMLEMARKIGKYS